MRSNISFYYNSWDLECKHPFGAVKVDTTVSFKVLTNHVSAVNLLIHQDHHHKESYTMARIDDGFTLDFKIGASDLFFYHFEVITDDHDILYFGNNDEFLGGEGYLTSQNDYQLTVYEFEDYAPLWYRESNAYHIFVDRFSKSKYSFDNLKENSFIYAKESDIPMYIRDQKDDILRWDFFAGDLWGIIDHLDYLASLSITTLYLSPIFTARSNHRYDTSNYMEVDPMIGGMEAFQALIKETKLRNMKIILDGVFNHCGADSIYFDRYQKHADGAYLNPSSKYYDWFSFNDDGTYEAWWGITDLPRFNQNNKEYQSYLLEVIKYWANQGIGGFRLDVADELSDAFIKEIRLALHDDQVLIGEVWEDPSNKIAYGQRRKYVLGGRLHGVMNYPLRDLIIDYLNQELDAEQFVLRFNNLKENLPHYVLYNNLNNIGSHDTKRIFTKLYKHKDRLKVALKILSIMPGVPCLYYGDEQYTQGGKDPDNRRFFDWTKIENDLTEYTKNHFNFRKDNYCLIHGEISLEAKEGLLIIKRYDKKRSLIFTINATNQRILNRVPNSISLKIDNFEKREQINGVLMPIFSLPGTLGIGDFGVSAYEFINFLAKDKVKLWQILPLHPLGPGNSPYQAYSSFAGDDIYIDIEDVYSDLNLDYKLGKLVSAAIDYDTVRTLKNEKLQVAFAHFNTKNTDYNNFIKNTKWLETYARFICLHEVNETSWNTWTSHYVEKEALEFIYFKQYYFHKQWVKLKAYANRNDIEIMGDIPFYVSYDSADVYEYPEYFLLDDNQNPIKAAGVPPDYFNDQGQHWGNPIYNWKKLKETNYQWWIDRLAWEAAMFDIVRIDHFRAFDNYWQFDADEKTAVNGEWIDGPYDDFFKVLNEMLPDINLVAEDLGEIREATHLLRDKFNLSGMRVLQFEMNETSMCELLDLSPHTYMYTGTHDNQTLRGFIESQTDTSLIEINKILQKEAHHIITNADLISYLRTLPFETLIIPYYNLLNMNDKSRINTPGTLGSPNWEWKLKDFNDKRTID